MVKNKKNTNISRKRKGLRLDGVFDLSKLGIVLQEQFDPIV